MRLTKDVREALLLRNEGWETSTHYSSKNFTETRNYKIIDGQLHVRSRGKTSWADSRFNDSYAVDEEAAHRFLREHLWELETEGVQEAAAAIAAERRAARAAAPEPESVGDPVAGADDVGVPLGIATRGRHGTTIDRSVDVDKVVRWVGIALAVAPAVVAAAPHVPRLWQEQVIPRAKRLRGKFAPAPPVEVVGEGEGKHGSTPDSDQ